MCHPGDTGPRYESICRKLSIINDYSFWIYHVISSDAYALWSGINRSVLLNGYFNVYFEDLNKYEVSQFRDLLDFVGL